MTCIALDLDNSKDKYENNPLLLGASSLIGKRHINQQLQNNVINTATECVPSITGIEKTEHLTIPV